MRNIDYRALYEKVLDNDPKKRRGLYDKKTHDERTEDAIEGNEARRIGKKLADKGIGTGKKAVAPVEPANLQLAKEELMSIKEAVMEAVAEMSTDELWELMSLIDEAEGAGGPNAVSPNSVAKQFLNNLPSKGALGAKNLLQKPKLLPNKNIPGQHV